MALNRIQDIDLKGARVIVRVDFNVPFDPKTKEISDTTRIEATLPTIKYLIENNAKIVLLSHLGRPKGKNDENLSLKKVAKKLSEIIGKKVDFWDDISVAKEDLKEGEIAMFENLRFWKEEKACENEFAKKLSKFGDIFIFDAFSVSHRKHASVYGIAKFLPVYAGFLMQNEIRVLSKTIKNPERPLTLIMGGAKADTKIEVIRHFIKTNLVDNVLIGGAIANTFLLAMGFQIGKSLCQKDLRKIAEEIILLLDKEGKDLIIPEDVIVADSIGNNVEVLDLPIEDVNINMTIYDIGKKTREKFIEKINKSKTIVCNGPLGLTEYEPFLGGTKEIINAMIKSDAKIISGGGDTIQTLNKLNIDENKFYHISTGGGAMLDFMSGKKMPGLDILSIS